MLGYCSCFFDKTNVFFIVSTVLVEPSCEAAVTDTGDISIQVLIVAGKR